MLQRLGTSLALFSIFGLGDLLPNLGFCSFLLFSGAMNITSFPYLIAAYFFQQYMLKEEKV